MERSSSNARVFWGIGTTVVLADAFTKMLAVDRLVPSLLPRAVLGDAVRLTLVYNPGAAFGLHLGPYSRWIFTLLTLGALLLLWRLYQGTHRADRLRTLALSLVCGGAVGNLLDRLKSARGVVDFIDVGVGVHRWPTFNVADMAVSCGALLLAFVLWREDAEAAARATSGRDAPIQG
jgi:signal peptidase II